DKKVDVVFSKASLQWAQDHEAVLHGIKACLAPSGRVLLQMGGKGNAGAILEILYAMIDQSPWQEYFKEFSFPYGFYGPEEYTVWMNQAGLILKRAELIPKDMVHQGKEGLLAWIRTTWLPYTDRVPEPLREVFMEELARLYIKAYPVDEKGQIHISMMRLEVEATNRD
ncbi:MAG: SAM-dependent methyltransferase, partial [Chlamydiota bacterium]|nr:SAM-dependent methyltransferase [Chlamydiota bacterium]